MWNSVILVIEKDDKVENINFTTLGDFRMAIAAEICINYPTPKFMVLPFKLKVSSLTVTGNNICRLCMWKYFLIFAF